MNDSNKNNKFIINKNENYRKNWIDVLLRCFPEVERVPLSCSSSCSSNKEAAPLSWARLIFYITRNTHTFVTPLTKLLCLHCDVDTRKVSKQSRDARLLDAGWGDFDDIPFCCAGVRHRKPRAECSKQQQRQRRSGRVYRVASVLEEQPLLGYPSPAAGQWINSGSSPSGTFVTMDRGTAIIWFLDGDRGALLKAVTATVLCCTTCSFFCFFCFLYWTQWPLYNPRHFHSIFLKYLILLIMAHGVLLHNALQLLYTSTRFHAVASKRLFNFLTPVLVGIREDSI